MLQEACQVAYRARRPEPRAPRSADGEGPAHERRSKPYHHGDLRRVLVDAARTNWWPRAGWASVCARRRGGPVFRRGAPFRHFASRDALLAAVAEKRSDASARRSARRWSR